MENTEEKEKKPRGLLFAKSCCRGRVWPEQLILCEGLHCAEPDG